MHQKYFIVVLVSLLACEQVPTAGDGHLIDVDIDALFAVPTVAEIAQISSDWEGRDVAANAVALILRDTIHINNHQLSLDIISHEVDASTHVGALLAPLAGLASNPNILVYLHGGDNGVSITEVAFAIIATGINLANTLLVVPSFRGEDIFYLGHLYQSSNTPSPWDRDVDDALALINAGINYHGLTGAPKIVLLGFSRGAGVGLLMSVRDPRIIGMAEFFGPTDFFDEFVREIAQEAFDGHPRNLPGLDYIIENFLLPFQVGDLAIGAMRLEMVRRSPVLFAENLPSLQIHHGYNDSTVYVSQAESLISALDALGENAPAYEAYLYETGGHWPWELAGSLTTAGRFINTLLVGGIAKAEQLAVPQFGPVN